MPGQARLDAPGTPHHIIIRGIEAERTYPAEGTFERTQLEGATQWVYDIFTGKAPMPENFFDPKTGQLLLPSQYQGRQQHGAGQSPGASSGLYSAPTTPSEQ